MVKIILTALYAKTLITKKGLLLAQVRLVSYIFQAYIEKSLFIIPFCLLRDGDIYDTLCMH